jgi:hypothetical protein
MTPVPPSEADLRRARQKGRNRALGLTLGLLALLFFAITIVKLGLKAGGSG